MGSVSIGRTVNPFPHAHAYLGVECIQFLMQEGNHPYDHSVILIPHARRHSFFPHAGRHSRLFFLPDFVVYNSLYDRGHVLTLT